MPVVAEQSAGTPKAKRVDSRATPAQRIRSSTHRFPSSGSHSRKSSSRSSINTTTTTTTTNNNTSGGLLQDLSTNCQSEGPRRVVSGRRLSLSCGHFGAGPNALEQSSIEDAGLDVSESDLSQLLESAAQQQNESPTRPSQQQHEQNHQQQQQRRRQQQHGNCKTPSGRWRSGEAHHQSTREVLTTPQASAVKDSFVSGDEGSPAFWDVVRRDYTCVTPSADGCRAASDDEDITRFIRSISFSTRWLLEKIFLPSPRAIGGDALPGLGGCTSALRTFLGTGLGSKAMREVQRVQAVSWKPLHRERLFDNELRFRLHKLKLRFDTGGCSDQHRRTEASVSVEAMREIGTAAFDVQPQFAANMRQLATQAAPDAQTTSLTSSAVPPPSQGDFAASHSPVARRFEACLDLDTGFLTLRGPTYLPAGCSNRAYREFGEDRFLALRYVRSGTFSSEHKYRWRAECPMVQQLVANGVCICGRVYKWLCHKHDSPKKERAPRGNDSQQVHTVEAFSSILFAERAVVGGVHQQLDALPSMTVEAVRRWHINLSIPGNNAITLAKYNARFQLAFSTTRAVPLPPCSAVFEVPDLMSTSDQSTLLTDGAAPISMDLMRHVAQSLGWSHVPSAFQGRFGGCKGVWYAVPNCRGDTCTASCPWLQHGKCVLFRGDTRSSDAEDVGFDAAISCERSMWIAIRPSMIKVHTDWSKCTNTQTHIEVCAAHDRFNTHHAPVESSRKRGAASLNRQLLLLLESRGVSHKTIELVTQRVLNTIGTATAGPANCQHKRPSTNGGGGEVSASDLSSELQPCAAAAEMTSWSHAPRPSWLREQGDNLAVAVAAMGHPISASSWFDFARHALQESWISALEQKLCVPIQQSRRLLMLPDPLGALTGCEFTPLSPGQVFIQVSGVGTITGPVLLARNPCFLPSDILKCEAVDPFSMHYCEGCDQTPECKCTRGAGTNGCIACAGALTSLRETLVDVVVFASAPALCLSSDAHRLSGGDFDGDTCWVCWDPLITSEVAPIEVSLRTARLPGAKSVPHPLLKRGLLTQSVREFFQSEIPGNSIANAEERPRDKFCSPVLFCHNDFSASALARLFVELGCASSASRMGFLASLHEDWADFLAPDGGAGHSCCLELASLCHRSVDAPKSGEAAVQVPSWAAAKRPRVPHWRSAGPRRSESAIARAFDTVRNWEHQKRGRAAGVAPKSHGRTESWFAPGARERLRRGGSEGAAFTRLVQGFMTLLESFARNLKLTKSWCCANARAGKPDSLRDAGFNEDGRSVFADMRAVYVGTFQEIIFPPDTPDARSGQSNCRTMDDTAAVALLFALDLSVRHGLCGPSAREQSETWLAKQSFSTVKIAQELTMDAVGIENVADLIKREEHRFLTACSGGEEPVEIAGDPSVEIEDASFADGKSFHLDAEVSLMFHDLSHTPRPPAKAGPSVPTDLHTCVVLSPIPTSVDTSQPRMQHADCFDAIDSSFADLSIADTGTGVAPPDC